MNSSWTLWHLKMREKSHLNIKYSDETHAMNSTYLPDNQNEFHLIFLRISDHSSVSCLFSANLFSKWKYSESESIFKVKIFWSFLFDRFWGSVRLLVRCDWGAGDSQDKRRQRFKTNLSLIPKFSHFRRRHTWINICLIPKLSHIRRRQRWRIVISDKSITSQLSQIIPQLSHNDILVEDFLSRRLRWRILLSFMFRWREAMTQMILRSLKMLRAWQRWLDCSLALFDILIWNIDCRYIDTFEKYRYR